MACDVRDGKVKAFPRLVRYAEHYPDKTDSFDDTPYGGGKFVGYVAHPNKPVKQWGHVSTAAGAYQILVATRNEEKRDGIVTDLNPAARDKIAFHKLQTRGALASVCAGDLAVAFKLLGSGWTSLPGAKQTRMIADQGRSAFVEFGGAPK